jgi:hypothetical protein
MTQSRGLAVHGYGRYVDEEAFREAGVELSEEVPVYGVEASNYSRDLIGDFYEDSFSEIPNGRNGSVSSRHLENLEGPFYVFGGLVNECIPGAVYSVMRSGEEAYVVEDAAFEEVAEGEFMTYEDMQNSEEDFKDIFAQLNRLGALTLKMEDILER